MNKKSNLISLVTSVIIGIFLVKITVFLQFKCNQPFDREKEFNDRVKNYGLNQTAQINEQTAQINETFELPKWVKDTLVRKILSDSAFLKSQGIRFNKSIFASSYSQSIIDRNKNNHIYDILKSNLINNIEYKNLRDSCINFATIK